MAKANSNSFDVRVNVPYPLAVAAAALAPGEWASVISNYPTTLADLLRAGTRNITEYSDKMAWDPDRKKIYYTGGGHQADAKTIVYDDATNTWASAGTPPWLPAFFHGYSHNTYANGTHYHIQYGSKIVRTRDVRFDPLNNTWDSITFNSLNQNAAGSLEWFPTFEATGALMWAKGDDGLWKYKNSILTQIATAAQVPMGNYHNIGVYSSVRDIMYIGGGNGSRKLYTVDNAGNISSQTDCPVAYGIPTAITTVDPVNGNLIVITNDRVLRIFDPNSDWSTGTGPPSAFYTTGYVEGACMGIVACPIPTYGVTMYVTLTPASIYIRKGGA